MRVKPLFWIVAIMLAILSIVTKIEMRFQLKCRIKIKIPNEEKLFNRNHFFFAVRIVNLYKYLTTIKKEFVLSKQILEKWDINSNIRGVLYMKRRHERTKTPDNLSLYA
jgi:hypothetical protein